MLRTAVLLLLLPLCEALAPLPPSHTHVYLIGDSTMADKEIHKYPETGWGMPFRYYFDSTVVVDNRAMNGRSTKSFIAEQRWQAVYDSLQEGDYVFIQFGHNDESKTKKERYTTPEAFKENLKKFVRETRQRKATPVILSAVARRNFDSGGHITESHPVYAGLAYEVAREEQVAFIDLNEKTKALLDSFGAEQSKLLFLQLAPGENPNYPQGVTDNTHFSELGARKVAQIVIRELQQLHLPLAAHIYQPEVRKK